MKRKKSKFHIAISQNLRRSETIETISRTEETQRISNIWKAVFGNDLFDIF